ncbi:MAG: haloacid dehalogenase type II [Chlorobiales bacterium]|nr:haloacid dehalogenase type II [Chlorobiales bacterium]
MTQYAIGFDVYGTLVDPLQMNQHLRPLIGEQADRFAELWREKQIEYAFRRGLMEKYENFEVCTRQGLVYTMMAMKVELSDTDQERLMEEYQNLSAFPDVLDGLKTLKSQGHKMAAFSNGVPEHVKTLLERASVLQLLEGVISVDEVNTYKPNPVVYRHLAKRLERPLDQTWLISSNAWDVIGAKAAGLKAAWIKRSENKIFDPWGIDADAVVSDLRALADFMDGR